MLHSIRRIGKVLTSMALYIQLTRDARISFRRPEN